MIEDSTRRHLISDVPVATFLSGGLDSSYLTALAARHRPGIAAYTIGFRDADARFEAMPDDLRYARRVADRFGVDLREIEIAPDVLEMLPAMARHLDEPIGDPAAINTYLICTAAREAGVKVLLSGMGADELFAGYRKHAANLLALRYQRLPAAIRRPVGAGRREPPGGVGPAGLPLGPVRQALPLLRRSPRGDRVPPQLHDVRPRGAARPGRTRTWPARSTTCSPSTPRSTRTTR